MPLRQYLPSDVADWVQLGVLVVAFYALLRLVRGTIAASLLRGAITLASLFVFVAAVVLRLFELRVLQSILSALLGTTVLALLIVFQPELRRALLSLGEHRLLDRFRRRRRRTSLDVLVAAVQAAAAARRGVLIAIERGNELGHIADTGTLLDAQPTEELFAAIFWPGGPLHDGGVVFRAGRIVAAGCIFPLAERRDIDPRLGTRHRAGIGLSDVCDAIVVMVSEETGRVCVAVGGQYRFVDPVDELPRMLEKLTGSIAGAGAAAQPASTPPQGVTV